MKPHHVPSSAPLLATVSAAVLLAACGGNSDGDAEAPLPKPTAIVNAAGTIVNTVTLTSSVEPDPDPTDNVDTAPVVTPLPSAAPTVKWPP